MFRECVNAAAIALPAMAFATAAQAQADFSGRWETNMGAMFIQQGVDHVTGRYEMKGGRVEGDVDGDTLHGVWTQYSADHRCFEQRGGSFYWGRFSLHLSSDGDRFDGRWSYCNDERGSGGSWNGERHHRRTWRHDR